MCGNRSRHILPGGVKASSERAVHRDSFATALACAYKRTEVRDN